MKLRFYLHIHNSQSIHHQSPQTPLCTLVAGVEVRGILSSCIFSKVLIIRCQGAGTLTQEGAQSSVSGVTLP